jgi:pimeloyl-ACP methyl ester carboxylesterase
VVCLALPGWSVVVLADAEMRNASLWRGRTELTALIAYLPQSPGGGAAQWHVACCERDMLKILLVSLTMTTACATSDKPAAPGGDAMTANNKSATAGNVAFASSKDGTRIAFEKVGKGPALIIVGGALSHRNGGKPLAGKLMERFTVYAYDRRGRGESGDTKPYAVDREIEDLGALIDQAGNKAYLYGVSSGAALSLQAAAKLGPGKVQKLALYEAPYGQDERDFNEQKNRINQLVQTGKPGDAAAFFLSAIGTPPPVLEDMKRSPEWEGISKTDFTLTYDYAVLGNGNVPDAAKLITIPTLVLDGEKTLDFIHGSADRIAELVPNAQRKTLKGQSHQAAPEAVAPLLIEFFSEGS